LGIDYRRVGVVVGLWWGCGGVVGVIGGAAPYGPSLLAHHVSDK